MKVFTIETETNNIAIHASVEQAEAVQGAERFRSEATLAKGAADWPTARLVELWNGLPGQTPIKKFKDRATAVARIWRAIQSLEVAPAQEPADAVAKASGATTPQTPNVAPEEPALARKASRAKRTPKPAQNAKSARAGSKTQTVLGLLRRQGGVTAKELIEATGWQPHSVRGFLSGAVRKNMGLTVVSAKNRDGERAYSIQA